MFFTTDYRPRPALLLLAGLILGVASCTVDPAYDVKMSDVDMTVTVFEDGISIPIGDTEKITFSELLNEAGEGINDYLKTGDNGELILTYDGSVSLDEELAKLDFANAAALDGVEFASDFNYHIGNVDAANFTIPGDTYDIKFGLGASDFVNINTGSISSDFSDLGFKAGLGGYKSAIDGNADLDLSSKIAPVAKNYDILKKSDLSAAVAAYPGEDIPASVIGPLVPDVELAAASLNISVPGFKLHDDIKAITNVKTSPAAKMVIEVKANNVFLTGGTLVPNVNLDLSSLLKIKGGSDINLSSLVLSAANSWAVTKSYDIEGLATTDFGNTISLNENIGVSGTVSLNDPATTKTAFGATSGDINLDIKVSFTDLKIESADVAVKDIKSEQSTTVSLGGFDKTTLPPEVKSVSAITMDKSNPIQLRIQPYNLNILKNKDIPYTIEITFPESIEVDGAVDGKLTLAGNLAGGVSTQDIILSKITPTISGGALTVDADLDINAKFEAKDLVINTANLPANPASDLTFEVSIEGKPTIKDFSVELNNYERSIDFANTLEFPVAGLGNFGKFSVTPKNSPVLVLGFSIPTIAGQAIVPAGEGIKVSLPKILEFDAKYLDPALAFNKAENSIQIKGAIPASISLPIVKINIDPNSEDTQDDKIVSAYSVVGAIVIPGATINKSELQKVLEKDMGLKVILPDLESESFNLEDGLSFEINHKSDFTLKGIPEEVKKLDELVLDDVFVNMNASFTGLPADKDFEADLAVNLPDFFTPKVIPVKGTISGGKFSITPVKLEKLSALEIPEDRIIKDEVSITGTIKASGNDFDIASLPSDISAKLAMSIMNKQGKIGVKKASGNFEYSVNEKSTIKLDDLPEQLKSDNVKLDVADPQLTLTLNTNLGIPMMADLELIPYRNGAPDALSAITLKGIEFPYSASAASSASRKYCIGGNKATAPAGVEFLEANVARLLRDLPEKIDISIKAAVDPDEVCVLEPSAKYTMTIDYGIVIPLAFGENFNFSTSAEMDLSSASSLLSGGDFGIKGKAVNQSPLALAITMDLLDANGAVIPQSKSSQLNIAAATTSDIEFYLSPSDKSRAVKKAKLDIVITAKPGVPVKKSDYLQLTDLKVVAPEGLTVNPNEL